MLIKLKNKESLVIDDFKFNCSIGKTGLKKHKIEGDKSTPKGIFSLGNVYNRSDRVIKPKTKLKIVSIKKNMVWCNDPKNKFYNKEIDIKKNIRCEKIFRKDRKVSTKITNRRFRGKRQLNATSCNSSSHCKHNTSHEKSF